MAANGSESQHMVGEDRPRPFPPRLAKDNPTKTSTGTCFLRACGIEV